MNLGALPAWPAKVSRGGSGGRSTLPQKRQAAGWPFANSSGAPQRLHAIAVSYARCTAETGAFYGRRAAWNTAAVEPGNLIAGRFEIERLAGRGGMALVYRARDLSTGTVVAVKVLHDEGSPHAVERFARETAVLADLTHPAIVRHVSHGRTERGQLFLAMEWLEGSTLSAVLKRGGLVARDAVELVRRVAEGLGAAHARGFLHRDVKPSNILLVDDDVRRVKLVDFGVAHVTMAAQSSMTRTGVMLGTPGYMAPEQARGDRGIDARADVFSLGCVLFECLAGRPPFYGDNLMAVLAKILIEEVPRVSELEPSVLPSLDALVARMLAKDCALRPPDARAVAIELSALGDVGLAVPSPRARASAPPAALTIGEQRVLTVVLAGGRDRPTTERGTAIVSAIEPTGGSLADLRAEVARHGGKFEKVLGGSLVATFLARGSATDQVAQAARCALALRAYLANTGIAIATGRGQVASAWPVGEAIDRAAAMLRADAAAIATDGDRPIRIDDTTAGLLDGRFEVGGDDHGLELVGERVADASLRTLLGRPIPCIGREREIGQIQQVFDECIAEPVARAVLVTAAPGVGKSRIRYEIVRAAQYREGTRVEIWIGRGDPVGAGAPFGLVGQAIARSAGIRAGEPLEVRRRKLRARVARNVPAADAGRIAEFLGEIVGTPFHVDDAPDSAPISKQLRAARDDARLMGDQMRRAFEDFVAAECAVQPVMLVLEDLQWGDVPTVQLIDGALRHAAERPFFVFAVGRPEVREMFPRLWEERGLVLMLLRELKKSSAEKIVREVLGQEATPSMVADLVDRAGGNAFYLEELVRAVADGKGGSLPETVLAMIEVRLESLEPEARQVLRAASVFGQVFWSRGVGVLLGDSKHSSTVADWLDELVAREIVQRRREGRFPDEPELVFRHALVREGAYAMLTEEDRRLGHRLAGKWLRAAGETNAVVLAEHFEKGGLFEEAIAGYRAATLQALEGNDLRGVIARAERGVACGARRAKCSVTPPRRGREPRLARRERRGRGAGDRGDGSLAQGKPGLVHRRRDHRPDRRAGRRLRPPRLDRRAPRRRVAE